MSSSSALPRRTLVRGGADPPGADPPGAGNEVMEDVMTDQQLMEAYYNVRYLQEEAKRASAANNPNPNDDITDDRA